MKMTSNHLRNLPRLQHRHVRATEAWLTQMDRESPLSSNIPSTELPFQRWFKFKEAYSPALIIECLRQARGQVRTSLDPFGGCGTTGLTSQFVGVRPTLVEVNPFIADLAEAKLASYDQLALLDDFDRLIRIGMRSNPLDKNLAWTSLPATFCEPGLGGRYLFPKATLGRILTYRRAIEALTDPTHVRLFRVLLGSILVACSNAVVNGKGRKYRRGWQTSQKRPEDVDRLFAEAFTSAIEDLTLYHDRPELEYTLLRGSCLSQIGTVAAHDVGICSPPYPNSFDYTDIYNIELWVLGYLQTSADNLQLRRATLRSHVQCTFDAVDRSIESPTLTKILRKLHRQRDTLWDPRLPKMVLGYFSDLTELMDQMRSALRADASFFFVVGDSCYADIPVRVADVLAEISEELGYEVRDQKVVRLMRVSAQQGGGHSLNESVLHLRNRSPRSSAPNRV